MAPKRKAKPKAKLTAKQEKFCQSIADGMNQSDAYRSAYNTEKTPIKKIWESASKLADQGKVTARIDELRAALTKKNLWTREMSVKILGNIALNQAVVENNKIAAIKELNAMHGYNSPTKLEITSNPLVLVLKRGT